MIKKFNLKYSIREFGFCCIFSKKLNSAEIEKNGNLILKSEIFNHLEKFLLKNNSEIYNFAQISYKKGIGRVIVFKNYVGTLTTDGGLSIEILPKLYLGTNSINPKSDYIKTKKIFLDMIKYIENINYKTIQAANVDTSKMDIIDVFINAFLSELSLLINKGLKSNYIYTEDNLSYLKGKLLIKDHILKNNIRKDKFCISFDDYNTNTSENKLIKSTLLKLENITSNIAIKNNVNRYLHYFEDIDKSFNYDLDFSKCINNRLFNDYAIILNWCEIILNNNSFSPFSGTTNTYGLLYPMDKVFERYVSKKIKLHNCLLNYQVILQSKNLKKYLFEENKKFKLEPDIIIQNQENRVILDTKWKILNSNTPNLGLSESDMYQMYCYAHKFKSKKIILIYPSTKNLRYISPHDLTYKSNDGISIEVFFIDLENISISLKKLIDMCLSYLH